MFKPKVKKFKNGLTAIVIPMPDNATVTTMVMVATGSKYETKHINGLSHFLEHMCFKGTEKRPQGIEISRELDSLGAESNAFTGEEYTGYYAKGRAKHMSKLLEIVSDIFLHSTFPEAEMEREKGVILDEINMYEDLPMRKVHEVFSALLYGDQPAGWTILGAKENIRHMKRDDFLAYHRDHYVASATTVVVAGGVNATTTFKEIERAFAPIATTKKKNKKKVAEKQTKPAVALSYKKTDQTHMVLGFRTVSRKHKDTAALSVLASVLGYGMSSRLFERVREQMGVGYYINAYHNTSTDTGSFEIATGVTNTRAGEVVDALVEECKKLVAEAVPEKELRKAKEVLISGMSMGYEASDDFARLFGLQMTLDGNVQTLQEKMKKIKAVTAKDVQRVAKKYFVEKGMNLALVGPFKKSDAFQKKMKLS